MNWESTWNPFPIPTADVGVSVHRATSADIDSLTEYYRKEVGDTALADRFDTGGAPTSAVVAAMISHWVLLAKSADGQIVGELGASRVTTGMEEIRWVITEHFEFRQLGASMATRTGAQRQLLKGGHTRGRIQ
jgi:hypothetical protein